MPKGMGYGSGNSGGSRSKGLGMGMGEGQVGNPSRQNSKQPGGGSGDFPGAFGKGPGSTSVAGVTYEGKASGDAASNRGGNYNMVGSKARVFGSGGKMKG